MLSRRSVIASVSLCSFPGTAFWRPAHQIWPGGVVSVTYDDGLDCHLDIAAPALAARNMLATFYVSWINVAKRWPEWIALGRQGHEIANHGVHHRCDIANLSSAEMVNEELAPMEHWLDSGFGDARDHDYAYPCDVTDLGPGNPNQQLQRYKRALRRAGISSARTSEGLPNPERWARHHPFRLQALAIGYDTQSIADVFAYLATAKTERRWAIVVFHSIAAKAIGSGAVSIADHHAIIDGISASGMPCRTVGSVVRGRP